MSNFLSEISVGDFCRLKHDSEIIPRSPRNLQRCQAYPRFHRACLWLPALLFCSVLHSFVSHRECFSCRVLPAWCCWLCLFHHFSVMFLLLLWLSRLHSEIVSYASALNVFIVYSSITPFVLWSRHWCFILKIDWLHHAFPLSDFLPGLICSVQFAVAAVRFHQKIDSACNLNREKRRNTSGTLLKRVMANRWKPQALSRTTAVSHNHIKITSGWWLLSL